MLGLPRGEVFLVPWTSEWEKEFISKKERIQNQIVLYTVEIHHIGSTAVEHLSSKPIIDIAIELEQFNDGKECISALESIGYTSHGTNILHSPVFVLGWYFIYKFRLGRLPKYEVIRTSKPSSSIHEIELKPVNGERLDYIAGQYGFFRFVDSEVASEAHPFSFSSSPTHNKDSVIVMIQEDGDFTGSLDKVEEGDKVTIEGPYGDFYPKEVRESNDPIVLLSGGIGVTPNFGVLREEIAKNSERRIVFIWGVGYEEELMYYDYLEELAEKHQNFSHHIIFSEEEVDGFANGFVDNEFIEAEGLEEFYETASWHVCGPPPMLEAAKKLLAENGVTDEQSNIEEFAF